MNLNQRKLINLLDRLSRPTPKQEEPIEITRNRQGTIATTKVDVWTLRAIIEAGIESLKRDSRAWQEKCRAEELLLFLQGDNVSPADAIIER